MDRPLLEFWECEEDEEGQTRQPLGMEGSSSSSSSISPSSLSLSDDPEHACCGEDIDRDHNGVSSSSMNRTMSQLLPELELEEAQLSGRSQRHWCQRKLWESPLCGEGSSIKQLGLSAMVVVTGVAHVVLFKLQTVPMYNYPTFLSLYSSFIYLFLYFCYLAFTLVRDWSTGPGALSGTAESDDATRANWKLIVSISLLSALGSLLQVVATSHVPGTLLILLLQSATPILVALHFWSQRREGIASYSQFGALAITAGVIVMLMFSGTTMRHQQHNWWPWHQKGGAENEPKEDHDSRNRLFDDDDFKVDDDDENHGHDRKGNDYIDTSDLVWTWAVLLVLSCLFLTFSAHVYKWTVSPRPSSSPRPRRLGLVSVNVLLATMHLIWATLLSIPIAMITFLPSSEWTIQRHWGDSVRCLFFSSNSIFENEESPMVHADQCENAVWWVHGAILASMLHVASLLLMVRYGSLKLLSSAVMITIVVAYAVFASLQAATPLPSSSDPWLDLLGLVVILVGVGFYRFGSASMSRRNQDNAHLAHGVLHSGIYFVDVYDEDNSNGGDTTSFMEFLREPFLLQGDV